MKEISLHILDIIQNSITAGASLIRISIRISNPKDTIAVEIEDNGCGMDSETARRVQSPFVTSRITRKVGLGIPMFKESALRTGGSFSLSSEKGKGTVVSASYGLSNIDRAPLGDITGVVYTMVISNPGLDFLFEYSVDDNHFAFDTRELRTVLGEVPLNTPDVAIWIKDYLNEGMKELFGGV